MRISLISAFTGFFLGWILWLLAMRITDASIMAPLNGLTMFFSVLLGAIFFREPVTRRITIGGTLMLAGVTVIGLFA
jgi:drug/metabolite transporter (DMT)-like permease